MKHGKPPHLIAWGATHKTAPEDLRARMVIHPDKIHDAYHNFRKSPHIQECMLVNTCNRLEIYAVVDTPEASQDIAQRFALFQGIPHEEINGHGFNLTNDKAIHHLFRVASGMDSLMIGENEIVGQIKESYNTAQDLNSLGPVLNKVVQKSLQQAKWARTHTGIAKGQTSIGMVCVDLATRIYGSLEPCRILVLGSGEVAEKTVEALHGRGARHITVSSRTYANARALAQQFNGAAIEFSLFESQLERFDIVIASTAAPGHILHKADLAVALKKRGNTPYFLIDLAMPRDIDPDVAELDAVYLYDLNDLAKIANENLQSRLLEVDRIQGTLAEKAEHLWHSIAKRFSL